VLKRTDNPQLLVSTLVEFFANVIKSWWIPTATTHE